MLTREVERQLHQVGADITFSADFKQAIQILLKHSPRSIFHRERRKENELLRVQLMTPEEKAAHIQKRITAAKERKERRATKKIEQRTSILNWLRIESEKMEGYKIMFFHYYSDKFIQDKKSKDEFNLRVLKATSCLLVDKNTRVILAKGITFSSDRDNPSRLEGRVKALVRAKRAIEEEQTRNPVTREEAEGIVKQINTEARWKSCWNSKIVYMPDKGQLTAVEAERVTAWKNRPQN